MAVCDEAFVVEGLSAPQRLRPSAGLASRCLIAGQKVAGVASFVEARLIHATLFEKPPVEDRPRGER